MARSPTSPRRACPLAAFFYDLFVRVYSLEAFDGYTLANPLAPLSSYVDDDALTTQADTEQEALSRMVQACAHMYVIFRDSLMVGLQADKFTTFGSSLSLARKLGTLLGQKAGLVTNSTVSLGTDLAPGQVRSARNALWKRRSRFDSMFKRHKKLQKMRGRLPRQKGRT
eukprot:3736121-Pyramimonas_sp.AAC.1